ncbi:hypothetical protein KIL84_022223 [Mauremys mutica]|uniref:Uncharacterized protein n=1 Tax=Mauremys mutica TaxID=74926 RepID=A0A9D3X9W2_9SAUR|nr:hypothetical protein KIL84_022223 [Mauremys mutica]
MWSSLEPASCLEWVTLPHSQPLQVAGSRSGTLCIELLRGDVAFLLGSQGVHSALLSYRGYQEMGGWFYPEVCICGAEAMWLVVISDSEPKYSPFQTAWKG